MTGKVLGKITSAEFGKVHDMPFLIGLKLEFQFGDGGGIGDGGKYTVNISPACAWGSEKERRDTIVNMIEMINKLLTDAKVNDVSKLKNKPVEVTIENNCFKDFRILTEVL